MVVGEAKKQNGSVDEVDDPGHNQQQQPTQHLGNINQATIDNIMSGIENTGAVKMNNHRKKLRQRFDIIKKLGQGTYGKVQLGINKETGQEVAIKTIKKSKIETEADLIRIRREVQIMSSVQHPNIIHIYEVFENREKMVLVMEFAAGGELYDYLSDRKVLTEDEARRIFRQVSTAIYYCHKHKICHRDLKLENILLDEHGNAKIADFGLSNVFDEQRLLATFCGSPLYASPEIVKGTPYQGPEVDCWSLGVLLYTLVYGAMPFDGANFKRLVKQISQGDYFEPKSPSRASPLIREMLTVCPIRRANIEQICNHWWVNEDYNESCLDLAEELANQTPVRLDVLLSLAPPSVTTDQVVVPTEEAKDRLQKSHSVGSIIDIAETEAERRILDMVAAGGEAAIMPSPTRTITPQETSPAQQPKRKLESTVSTENATGGAKKKEKAILESSSDLPQQSISEEMEVDTEQQPAETQPIVEEKPQENVQESLKKIEELCDELMEKTDKKKADKVEEKKEEPNKVEEAKKEAIKKISSPVKRDMVKHKTLDLSGPLSSITKDSDSPTTATKAVASASTTKVQPEKKEDTATVAKPTEKRRSRILETAEKFQNMNNQNNEKYKKFSIPGVSVGNFKKEFERKASLTDQGKKVVDSVNDKVIANNNNINVSTSSNNNVEANSKTPAVKNDNNTSAVSSSEKVEQKPSTPKDEQEELTQSDSKSSVQSFTLEEARRSMENSIAMLRKAKNEDVDKLCAKTESVTIQHGDSERERKLQAAREIIGNAIPPSRLFGIRKPPLYGLHGRSISGGVVQSPSTPIKTTTEQRPAMGRFSSIGHGGSQVVPERVNEKTPEPPEVKTSHAEITLKSATLPRRKPGKMEITVDIKPKSSLSSIKSPTEVYQQVPDLNSAPVRESPTTTYASFTIQNRSTSLEPKEHVINIQKPPTYQRTTSNSYRSPLSRQSTNDSNDSDITPSQSTITSSSDIQPIKKSPREFIIPISIEGGGIVTPKANNLEQSKSQSSTRTKRISSIFNERDSEEEGSATIFPKLHRHTSIGRESDSEEPRFHSMHRLRSSRPTKRSTVFSQDPTESDSGDDDDDDAFELLTAENLFSTLLSRVRALTHRLNVNNETTSNFPSTRFMSNLRQSNSPFWNNEPFGSSRTNMHPWRTNNLSRDFQNDFDSMFSRSGATLPRGKSSKANEKTTSDKNNNLGNEILDLGDLDLSQLRLTKKDLETLSSLTPSLSKNLQAQLLAQLPPTQAKKLSRTLSMQNKDATQDATIYRRSMSNNPREIVNRFTRDSLTPTNELFDSINNNHTPRYKHDDSINNNDIEKQYHRERTLSPDYRAQKYRISSPHEDIERACFSPPPLDTEKKTKKYGKYCEDSTRNTHMTSTINDKILDELNSISLLNNQLEKFDQLEIKESESKKTAGVSKISRPKSFITREIPLKAVNSSEKILDTNNSQIPSKLERPKSFPNSKLLAVKDLKVYSDDQPKAEVSPEKETKKVKKVKVVKKSVKKAAAASEQQPAEQPVPIKEKSPEKKASKGLLYTLGQKFEKLKVKKSEEPPPPQQPPALDLKEKKKKLKAMLSEDVDEATRLERKSKIDALIKNLKEKTIPTNTELTESGLIKRAVSVEEMPNAFNKNTVNKVLGLFKRIEKENEVKGSRVQNTKSTSFLSSMDAPEKESNCFIRTLTKERPKSSSFVSKVKNIETNLANISESKIPVKYSCPECKVDEKPVTKMSNGVTKRHTNEDSVNVEDKERLKSHRKGLMLDFSRLKSPEVEVQKSNYSFPPPLPKDVHQSSSTATYDNLSNYSSKAFEPSISSLSPNEEGGYDGWSTCSDDHTNSLYYPSNSLSRINKDLDDGDSPESVIDRIRRKSFYSRFNEKKAKRVSNIVGPAAKDYYRERSKPLEYTRSATSAIPDISTSRASSVEATPHVRSTTRYSSANRSLSQSRNLPNNSDSLQHSNSFRRTNDSIYHVSSLPPPYHVHHSHHHHDLLRSGDDVASKIKSNRNTMYDSSSSSSNTPSMSSLYAKRRSFVSTPSNSSSTSAHISPSSALKPPLSFVDSYATIGRKMRQYNTRSVSLLDSNVGNTSNVYVGDHHSRLNGYADSNLSSSRTLRSLRNPSVPRTSDNI